MDERSIEQTARGSGNVQIANVSGSTITVNWGGRARRLPLERAVLRANYARSPALMVNARFGIVPYVGRDDLRASLLAWAQAGDAFSVRILAGRGGSGKTKLAVEACVELEAAGWITGLLENDPRPDAAALEELAAVPAPRLIVVDYAETRLDDVAALLTTLDDAATTNDVTRVLLLVRGRRSAEAPDGVDVLAPQSTRVEAILSDATVDLLEESSLGAAGAEQLYEAALDSFTAALGTTPKPAPAMPDLAEPTPLLLSLAAYLAAVGEDRPDSADGVFDAVLGHEERYWSSKAADLELKLPPERARRVVALATMAEATDRDEAISLLRHLPELSDASQERLTDLADWATSLYPGPLFWNPLEPDLVGEHLVASTIGTEEPLLQSLFVNADDRARLRMLIVLGRTMANHDSVAAVASSWLRTAALGGENPVGLFLIADALDEREPPRELVSELLAASAIATASWDRELVAQKIASNTTIDADLRLEAVERLTSTSVTGYPWRLKDWTTRRDDPLSGRPSWPSDVIGGPLLDLAESNPDETVAMLLAWLSDTEPLESNDRTSRHDIALAILATHPSLAARAHDELASGNRELLWTLVRWSAEVQPAPILVLAERWSKMDDDVWRMAAFQAASASRRATTTPDGDQQRRILDTLVEADWSERDNVLTVAAELSPEEYRVRTLQAVAEGRVSPLAAKTFCESHPADAIDAIITAGSTRLAEAIDALDSLFSADRSVEARIVDLVHTAERLGDRYRVGTFAEHALYGANKADFPDAARGRLELATRCLVEGPGSARTAVLYATGQVPNTDVYAEFQRDLASGLSTSDDHLDLRAQILARTLREYQDGWPSASLVATLLADLDLGQVCDVLYASLRRLGVDVDEGSPRLRELIDELDIEPVGQLGAFVEAVEAGQRPFDVLLGRDP